MPGCAAPRGRGEPIHFRPMATSSQSAARRSLRPHTAPNVRENLRRERERLLARQAELETLAAPINDVAAQLAKLDEAVEARVMSPQRKIEQLQRRRDQRIERMKEKLEQEYAAKIAAIESEADTAGAHMTPDEQTQESTLLREYAQAIVEFSKNASPAELAPLLGMSTREAKKIIEQAKEDVDASSVAVSPAAVTPGPMRAADDTHPVTVAS